MNELVKWFTTLFLAASTTISSIFPKSNITPTPKFINCILISKGIDAPKDDKEYCDLHYVPPTPTLTPIPTREIYTIQLEMDSDPPVHCRMSAECGGGTTPLKQSECNNSTCCQIGDKWIFYKDKNQCDRDQGETPNSQPNYVISTGVTINSKVNCSYTGSGYSYNFGELTFDECMLKTDQYWKEQGQTQTNIPAVDNAALRDMCLGDLRSQYQSEITRLNIDRPNGSAYENSKNSIDRKYKSLEQNCKDQYPVK
ncbi:MAG: hypothetical protein WCT77_00990 [Bacteroidota bacterium]